MRTRNPIFGWLKMLVSRIRTPVTMRRLDQDFGEELEAHLALFTEENIRRRLTPEEAGRAARVRLGGVTQLRETVCSSGSPLQIRPRTPQWSF